MESQHSIVVDVAEGGGLNSGLMNLNIALYPLYILVLNVFVPVHKSTAKYSFLN